ncbi:hypothetical protein FKW77_008825 [Venturia effusa]|uniref:ubiquitinyl hydrolase 1 n=1 Tax=Venturia effusa TaxID=50376 RepID=A0A517LHT3_9PEZI|nr:hypothetical protein FKW77_008825 [Venturia effusa]
METYGSDDDDSFDEQLLQLASRAESFSHHQTGPLIIEVDDSLDDAESASQARAGAEHDHITTCPRSIVTISDDDEFGSEVNEDELLAAFEAVTSTTDKHAIASDQRRPTKRTKTEAPIMTNFAQTNRQRPSALRFEPWTSVPHVGEVDFGEPDFQDPDNIASLELVKQQARNAGLPLNAEMQAILHNAFTAGHMSQHRVWKRRYTYDFLTLPAEIRLSIYGYSLRDTNPNTVGKNIQALPSCKRLSSTLEGHCYVGRVAQTAWPDVDEKPWINLALLRTCKQVYRETRDEFLYRTRHFDAKAVLDNTFDQVMKLSPKLVFWQHIQHIHLILRPVDNYTQWTRHVYFGVDSLIALLCGGKRLKSFQLSWQFTQFAERIKNFGALQVSGSIVITQHFDDATVKDGRDRTAEREERIKLLIKSMQGLPPDAIVQYDSIISQTPDRIGPVVKRSEMQIHIGIQEPRPTASETASSIIASSPERAFNSASPEPPRYLPPHLQPDIQDAAAANGEGVLPNSSASSPSEAYAGLCLDSVEEPPLVHVTTRMSDENSWRDSLTLGNNGSTASNTSVPKVNADDTKMEGSRSRSHSPAKRRADAMEDANGEEEVEKMEVDGGNTILQNVQSSMAALSSMNASDCESHDRSVDMLRQAQSDRPAKDLPSIDEQVKIIMEKMTASQADRRDGDIGYAVSMAWLNRVLARSSSSQDHGPFDKSVLEGEIGPIDNTDILPSNPLETAIKDDYDQVFVPLKPGMALVTNLEILPVNAYAQIKKWYGVTPGQAEILRYAHATAADENAVDQFVQWELYPPVFTIRKLAKSTMLADKHKVKDLNTKAPRLVASRSDKFHKFLLRAKDAASIPKATKVKVWRVLEVEAASNTMSVTGKTSAPMLSPPASHNGSSRESSPAPQIISDYPLILSNDAFKNMAESIEREHVEMKDETNNSNYNGSIQLGTLGLAADQVLILEEPISYPGKEEFTSDLKINKGGKSDSISGGILGASGGSGRSSPVPTGAMTRGRHRQQGRSKGTVGLTNLGNTCYMNSALQCVRANAELTTFFLAGQWTNDLNPKNPLGYGGAIAKQYQMLLESIYKQNNSSVPPRTFKNTLGKYGPQFSGYGQQDSQEFMSFLLDALHEDLNRIDNKPYIENPDSDDSRVADPEYVKELGEIYQSNYRKRNDSVVTDLFNGFYKNMMVCPVCDKVSITFDPYSLLTLQLPIEHSFQFQFMYFPLHGTPVLIDIDMDKNSTLRQVKEYVGSKMNADAKRIMLAETFNNKFFRTCEDKTVISEANIQPRDTMVMYELEEVPSNFPPPKKKAKAKSMLLYQQDSEEEDLPDSESPLSDRMLVPVFFRAQSNSYSNSKNLVLTPTFITLRREEQISYTEIYRKILSRLAGQTTRPFLTEGEGQSGTSTPATDQDVIITTEEDAADPSLATRSVESEDGMVDVLMGDDVTNAHSEQESVTSLPANTPIPSVLRPGAPIPDTLWTIMELKLLPAGTEMISTGWNSVDGSKNYTSMSSRLPRVVDSTPEPSPAVSPESSDVDEMSEEIVQSAQPSFVNGVEGEVEDDDDEELLLFENGKPSAAHNPKANGKNGRKKNRKNRQLTTYSKKGQNHHRPQEQSKPRALASPDVAKPKTNDSNAALIRLGEAIVVDFDYGAYDALFNGDGQDGRGQDTAKLAPLFSDPILTEKKARRAANRKNGISLDDCFSATSKGEVLTEENQWYCNRCKELRQAEKTLEIWTAPDVLVIHLKRFSASRNLRDKIDVKVEFPIEGLDLTHRVGVSDGKTLKYDLFAVDNHYGGLGGGHYTAFAKNFLDGNCSIDDSYDGDEDEGVGGMGFHGPELPSYGDTTNTYSISEQFNPSWAFGSALVGIGQKDDDNDSVTGMDGEADDGGANLRHLEAFGDGDGNDFEAFQTGSSGPRASPILATTEHDDIVPDMDFSDGLLGDHSMDTHEVIPAFIGMEGNEDVEEEVAEVRLEDDELAVDHAKTE